MLGVFLKTTKGNAKNFLSSGEIASICYHDIFDFPLTFAEIIRWQMAKGAIGKNFNSQVTSKRGYFFLDGKDGLIYKRLLKKRTSLKKVAIAKKAAKLLGMLPTVKMVGISGSLAMENASEGSDVDLIIITRRNSLWMTRLIAYLFLMVFNFPLRRPSDKNQNDKLCLNIWLDESDMVWKKRNVYTAHEIAQIVPLVNKDKTYGKFLWKNKWVLSYWPNAVKIGNWKLETGNFRARIGLAEKVAYLIQLNYMRNKMTRETVTPTRALFHPFDWGQVVLDRINAAPLK
jgi:predicted nucleotidyltransferase